MKNLKDIAITTLALGTAFGFGIITTVYVELKWINEALAECNNKKDHE